MFTLSIPFYFYMHYVHDILQSEVSDAFIRYTNNKHHHVTKSYGGNRFVAYYSYKYYITLEIERLDPFFVMTIVCQLKLEKYI